MNPASGGGRTGRQFDRIARAVQEAMGEFRAVFTTRPGEAAEMARDAARAGERMVVAVGGDGTASEVVDGLAGAIGAGQGAGAAAGGAAAAGEATDVDAGVLFGCIPHGTGGDLRRSLGWPSAPEESARALAVGVTVSCDVGVVEYVDAEGRQRSRHFVNVSSCGVSGRVVRELARGGRLGGGKLTYTLASAKALLGYRDQPVRWRADGGPWVEEEITAMAVCNGRYFGAGMMVAPSARLDDGWLDLTVWKGLGFGDFLTKRRMLYDGSHVRLPNTRCLRVRVVEAEPLRGAEVLLDVDGEQPGRLPARWSLLPGALRVRVPLARP
ncbi:MAG TPA: diacylglycerol kinase family protein [Anaeromyxobacteraceae bacterium]|nr:diacylglycerol kinase family protein [Anaeromyxobacteraceae bacterium]